MGAAKRREKAVLTQALQAMVVDTSGGRIHVQWDPTARIPRPGSHGQDSTASAAPNAQLTFFAGFTAATVATTGLYESWLDSGPLISTLSYSSPNAPGKRDVLGTRPPPPCLPPEPLALTG